MTNIDCDCDVCVLRRMANASTALLQRLSEMMKARTAERDRYKAALEEIAKGHDGSVVMIAQKALKT